jgi:hypothetical protein
MKLPAMRVKEIGIVSIVLIVGLSLGLFLHIQNISQISINLTYLVSRGRVRWNLSRIFHNV